MKHIKKNIPTIICERSNVRNEVSPWKPMAFLFLLLGFISCTDFVEVEPPKNNLISESVFEDPATVESALAHIYFQMRDQSMVSGNDGLSTLMGIYTDELVYYLFDPNNVQLYQHNVLPSNGTLTSWWSTSYSIVYEQCIQDVIEAVTLLDTDDATGERVIPNQATANALLARLYLYTENWEMAEITATKLINAYPLETDITNVFLKNASGTLWQFKPNGISDQNTYEANQFSIRFIPGQIFALTNTLLDAFESGDLRRDNWVGAHTSSDGLTTLNFAYKYKSLFSEEESLEYSVVFRLAEQYLIRAEARAHLGNSIGSQTDLNAIRNRAGLPNTDASTTEELIAAILQERFVELFTEYGHRWFDLKRLGRAKNTLAPLKTNWKDTDLLFPIPETELEVNPNLKPQNLGY